MTGDVVLLNSCLASGACVDITVRDGVIHEIGNTEATGGTPKSDRENAAIDPLIDFRSSPSSGRKRVHEFESGFDPQRSSREMRFAALRCTNNQDFRFALIWSVIASL